MGDGTEPQPANVPSPPSFEPHFHQVVRKLLRLGSSYAITIPTRWVERHADQRHPYVTVSDHADGLLTVRPLVPKERPAIETPTP